MTSTSNAQKQAWIDITYKVQNDASHASERHTFGASNKKVCGSPSIKVPIVCSMHSH